MAALDTVEETARQIGAVNTLVFAADGKVSGHNTDWIGAVRALEPCLDLQGVRVLVLGAGGSARAVGFGLRQAGAEPVIANRSRERGLALSQDLDCDFVPLDEAETIAAQVLVNTTSVGMVPHQDQSPFPAAALARFQVVMDIVYAPRTTRLLAAAMEAGCMVVDGLAMLLHQGAAQFELWTGEPAPLAAMDRALREALEI
jgi:shikimate dehydrogenase